MSLIELRNLNYSYDVDNSYKAVNSVNLKIEEGQYVCLIGKTGSGKTTLAKNLSLILRPTSGQVLFNGLDVWENKSFENKVRMKIGLIFQFAHHQLFAETVESDIAFGPNQLGLSKNEVKNRVFFAASLVGIDESLFKKSPFELSGGQQKRVAIAGVLAMKPKILILDEPTVGIDPKGKQQILKIIKNYHLKENCTTIHVTHDMQDVANLADEVIIMADGKVVAFDLVERIFQKGDFLQSFGFDLPPIVEVFLKLKRKGFNLPTNVYNVEQAVALIKNLVLGEVKNHNGW